MTALVMTEPERRRAAGETPFFDTVADVKTARCHLRDVASGQWDVYYASKNSWACSNVAALLRALVLQELLVTFSPPWEVTP